MTSLTEAARMALEALESVLCDPEGKASIRGSDEDLRIVDAALDSLRTALAQSAEPMCMCKDRPASQCPGEWEPGCDLGNNPKYVRMYHPPAQRDERAAFEAAMIAQHHAYRTERGTLMFIDDDEIAMWTGWQARAALEKP